MSPLSRATAVVALVVDALLVLAVVLFLVNNVVHVVVGVVGLGLAVSGGWWAVTERMPRRAIGAVALVAGSAIVITALALAGNDAARVLLRVVVFVALLALAVVTTRAAVAAGHRPRLEARVRRVSAPVHPVLLCNPWSGGGKVERFGLLELAATMGVETVLLDHGLDLGRLARDAIERGADCLGMAGGDGSQALVSAICIEHDLPFVCVSAGTRNHFALDLGLDRTDPRRSMAAFRDAMERRVDYATVNGRLFVNNVSLGVYATIVQQEGYRDAKADTTRTLLPELLGRTPEPFDLQFSTPGGEDVDGAFLVMVSNNPYVLGVASDMSQRRSLDSGQLGVFAVTATTGAHAADVVMHALAGRSSRSGHAFEFTAPEFEVRSRSGQAYAGIDGEALELDTPLRFRIHPRGLRLLVPEASIEATVRRAARGPHLGDLLAIARGAPASTPGPADRGDQTDRIQQTPETDQPDRTGSRD